MDECLRKEGLARWPPVSDCHEESPAISADDTECRVAGKGRFSRDRYSGASLRRPAATKSRRRL